MAHLKTHVKRLLGYSGIAHIGLLLLGLGIGTQRGIGVLITDHNVRETLDLVSRAYIIHDGMVLTHGTAQEIINNEDVRRVYLGEQFRI